MPSGDRSDGLAGPSSSKEQESQVPATGTNTGDQVMQESAEPSSSAEAGNMSVAGLEGTLSHVLTLEEKKQLFLKVKRVIDEEKKKKEEDEKKNEKSRQGKSVRFKRQPIPSVAPSQGPDKRTASFDEAEQSSKRRRVGPLPPSQAVEEPAIAEHTTASDKTEEADIETRGNPPASALVVPEAPVLSAPGPFRWADVRNPGRPLLCIIQVNYSSRVGSLAEDTKEWAFQLTFDAGRRRIPTMNMSIFSNGIAGPQRGRTAWCLGDYIEGDWMVTDFKIHRVADRARDRRIAHNKILAACKTDEEWARLVCISLEAWPKILGHFSGYGRCRNPNEGVKELFSAVFEGRRPYHLFIWFLAPDNLEAFERQCLSYFTRYFEQRKLPHEDFHDADDVSFAEHLQAQEQASST